MGVSPRRLTGWEPATVTTFVYEGDRLVRAVTVPESEFSDEDLARLRGHLKDERAPRGSHGQPMLEATSRDADPSNPDQKIGYEVEVWTDFAAKALSDFTRAYKAKYGDDVNLDELKFLVKKVDLGLPTHAGS